MRSTTCAASTEKWLQKNSQLLALHLIPAFCCSRLEFVEVHFRRLIKRTKAESRQKKCLPSSERALRTRNPCEAHNLPARACRQFHRKGLTGYLVLNRAVCAAKACFYLLKNRGITYFESSLFGGSESRPRLIRIDRGRNRRNLKF
jgi:hypothetical protein